MQSTSTLAKVVLWLLAIVLAGVILKTLGFILKPLVMAIFFVLCAMPLRAQLQRLKFPPTVVNILLPLIILGVLILFGWFATYNIQGLVQRFPVYHAHFEILWNRAVPLVGEYVPSLQQRMQSFQIPWATLGRMLGNGVGSFFSMMAVSVVVFMFMFFLFFELTSFPQRYISAYGERRFEQLRSLFIRINGGVLAYIRVKALVSLMVAGISTVIMGVMGVDFWPFWGLVTFFGNFIPYIGSFIAIAIPAFLLLAETGSIFQVLLLLGLLVATQKIIESVIEPLLTGKTLDLSPFVLILSFIVWTWLWGFTGMVLAVPIMVTIKIALETMPQTKPIAKLLGGGRPKDAPSA